MSGIIKTFGEVPYCGAVIISPSKIISAAHCVYNRTLPTLIVGTLNTSMPYGIVNVTEDEMIIHPGYDNMLPLSNDLVVFELNKRLNFKVNKINEIKLVKRNYVPKPGEEVYALGYSKPQVISDETNINGHTLQLVFSTISDFNTCQNDYHTFLEGFLRKYNVDGLDIWAGFNVPKIDKTQICISTLNGNSILNKGDSGGPLITKNNELLGLASFSEEGLPAVFTLVSHHLDFIHHPKKFVADYRAKHHSEPNPHMRTVVV
ncbi:enteropeptidase-like isoform X2 [Contarinia nasturtii]|nr:enteropeptidase-like isoform X2 [Contarinia nasturtii]